MNFIPGHAIWFQKVIGSEILESLLQKWDYYQIERNIDMVDYIWNILYPLIPTEYEGKKLIGYDINKVYLHNSKNKSGRIFKNDFFEITKYKKEKENEERNTKSLLTICIFCQSYNSSIRFYDDKKSNIFFSNVKADFFAVSHKQGDLVLYTNKISYEEISEQTCLKIPVYYSNKNYGKLYEMPTPNGEIFNNVFYTDNYGNNVMLSPNLSNPDSIERWNDVEGKAKVLKIQKYQIPLHINRKKGRPPIENEDYCPNCYEIIPLNTIYENCSGCLSPIL